MAIWSANSGQREHARAMSRTALGVTPVSGISVIRGRAQAGKVLARTWLGSACATMLLSGCLFPEPPDYRRDKTPPFLWAPYPPVTKVRTLEVEETLELSVNVRSEDDGEGLKAHLFLNYPDAPDLQKGYKDLRPATFQQERKIEFPWRAPPTPGVCERLTLLVAHVSSFDEETHLPKTDAEQDVAPVMWWVAILDPDHPGVTCPIAAGVEP